MQRQYLYISLFLLGVGIALNPLYGVIGNLLTAWIQDNPRRTWGIIIAAIALVIAFVVASVWYDRLSRTSEPHPRTSPQPHRSPKPPEPDFPYSYKLQPILPDG